MNSKDYKNLHFKFNEFEVLLKRVTEKMPNDQVKVVKIFYKLEYKGKAVIDDLFELIDLIEILKGFSGNKLTTNKTYFIGDVTAEVVQKDKVNYLLICFKDESKLYLDKFECSSLAAKLSKATARCEAWQE
jgi:hypothetical protein